MKIKKLILSLGVAVTFIVYSFAVRNQGGRAVVLAPAAITPTKSSSSQTQTNTNPATTISPSTTSTVSSYKDGTYTGSLEDAFYGNVEVSATIQNGKITDVKFLQYPNDSSHSQDINSQAMPYLQQEAIQAQSANVNIISGATLTSQAFIQSLGTAISKAQN